VTGATYDDPSQRLKHGGFVKYQRGKNNNAELDGCFWRFLLMPLRETAMNKKKIF
jgi:hypothetical protein